MIELLSPEVISKFVMALPLFALGLAFCISATLCLVGLVLSVVAKPFQVKDGEQRYKKQTMKVLLGATVVLGTLGILTFFFLSSHLTDTLVLIGESRI